MRSRCRSRSASRSPKARLYFPSSMAATMLAIFLSSDCNSRASDLIRCSNSTATRPTMVKPPPQHPHLSKPENKNFRRCARLSALPSSSRGIANDRLCWRRLTASHKSSSMRRSAGTWTTSQTSLAFGRATRLGRCLVRVMKRKPRTRGCLAAWPLFPTGAPPKTFSQKR